MAAIHLSLVHHSPSWVRKNRGNAAHEKLIVDFASALGLNKDAPLLEGRRVEVSVNFPLQFSLALQTEEDPNRVIGIAPKPFQIGVVIAC